MDYYKMKNKLLYSKAFSAGTAKAPKIAGYVSEGEYTMALERDARYVSAVSFKGLNADYASFLAVARSLAVPPYGAAGMIALKEMYGDAYNQAELSFSALESMFDEPLPDKIRQDLSYIYGTSSEGSEEAMVVRAVEDTKRLFSLYTKEEQEEIGGRIFYSALLDQIAFDENGNIQFKDFWHRTAEKVSGRDTGPKRDVIEEVKKRFAQKTEGLDPNDPAQCIHTIIGE